MANITRFDPFTDLAPFGREFFKNFSLQPLFRGMEMEPEIRMDISEDEKAYAIKAEIPGVRKEDIKVSVNGNMVSISAEVKKETEEKEGQKVIRSERYYGRVARSFSLDEEVDEGAAQAKYSDGVLELTLPKKPGASSRTIKIS
ncbi:MAG TPA: Hsp20/alpha crystallin family protein [Rhodocyclaceae bacterium]|nr:Hsp20/alpha crystallin family protein [Rhodocyclaceae bacterium]